MSIATVMILVGVGILFLFAVGYVGYRLFQYLRGIHWFFGK